MRKRQHAVQFSTVAKVLLVSMFLGGSGVGYVLQKGQIRSLRNQQVENEETIDGLVNDQRRWNSELNKATGGAQINGYLALHNLQMQQTDFRSIVTIREPQFSPRNAKMSLVRQ